MLFGPSELLVGLDRAVPKLTGVSFAQIVPALYLVTAISDIDIVSVSEDWAAFLIIHDSLALLVFSDFEDFNGAILNSVDKRASHGIFLIGEVFVLFPGAGSESPEEPLLTGIGDENGIGDVVGGLVECGGFELIGTCCEYFFCGWLGWQA